MSSTNRKEVHYAYVRVSSIDQNEARQRECLKKYDIDIWRIEKKSGKNISDRPELKALLDFSREGDTIYVHDFSRLARSLKDLLDIVELLDKKGVHLVSAKENLDTSTPTGKLMLTMLGAINEFERANILERQKEGIAIAKKEGKYKKNRRPKVSIPNIDQYYNDYMTRKISKSALARELGISRVTLNKLFKAYEEKLKEEPIELNNPKNN